MENYLIYSLEDDEDISLIISKTLSHQGYEVKSFPNTKDFFEAFNLVKTDLILLDLMLPDANGYDVLKKIRKDKDNNHIEVIILSAKSMLINKVEGLDLGADDYITKPFDLLELMSRVNARLRKHTKSNALTYEDLKLDKNKHIVTLKNEEIILTNKEFEILAFLLVHLGEVVSRDDLLFHLWGEDNTYESRTIDMHIKSLRTKLGDKEGKLIQTVYGIGYKIGK